MGCAQSMWLFGQMVCVMKARIQGFLAEYCTVATGSILFISTVTGCDVIVDQGIHNWGSANSALQVKGSDEPNPAGSGISFKRRVKLCVKQAKDICRLISGRLAELVSIASSATAGAESFLSISFNNEVH